jgi:3-hydroxybutyryl-CoA dehydrogenase
MAGVLPTLSNATEVPEPLRSMMQTGATGVRSGQGFYTYTRTEAEAWQQIYRRQVWRVRETVDEAFPLDAEIG